jgi:hypothetical protein
MKRNLFLLPIFIWLAFFLSSCTSAMQTQRTITTPIGWPTLKKSEAEFRKYLDDNADNLNVIEGIWTMHESTTWRNVYLSDVKRIFTESYSIPTCNRQRYHEFGLRLCGGRVGIRIFTLDSR